MVVLLNSIFYNNISKVDETSKQLYADVNNDTITFIKTSYSEIGKEKRTVSTSKKEKKAITIEALKE